MLHLDRVNCSDSNGIDDDSNGIDDSSSDIDNNGSMDKNSSIDNKSTNDEHTDNAEAKTGSSNVILPNYVRTLTGMEICGKKYDYFILFPHIGLFAVELCSETGCSNADEYIEVLKASKENEKHIQLFFKERFDVWPLVFCLKCYCDSEAESESFRFIREAQADGDMIIRRSELTGNLHLSKKLYDIYIGRLMADRDENSDIFVHTDIDDYLVDQIYKSWPEGIPRRKRPEKPPTLFLSYSSMNNVTAEMIQKELETRCGVYIFKCDGEVKISEDYEPIIMRNLEECDGLILLMSVASQKSEWVKREFETALEHQKPIYPYKMEQYLLDSYYSKHVHDMRSDFAENLQDDHVDSIDDFIELLTKHI